MITLRAEAPLKCNLVIDHFTQSYILATRSPPCLKPNRRGRRRLKRCSHNSINRDGGTLLKRLYRITLKLLYGHIVVFLFKYIRPMIRLKN